MKVATDNANTKPRRLWLSVDPSNMSRPVAAYMWHRDDLELLPGSAWEQQWRRFVEQLTRDDRITYISLGGNLTTRSVIVVVSFRADFSKIQKNELILLLAETFGKSVEEVTELPETPWAT